MNKSLKYLSLIILIFLFVGCGNITADVEENSIQNHSFEKELYEDEERKFIENLNNFVSTHTSRAIFDLVEENYDNFRNEKRKKEAIDIFNDYILKSLEDEEPTLSYFFFEPDSNEIKYGKYLKDETKQKIMEIENPIYVELLKQNLKMELISEYNNVITFDAFRPTVFDWLKENNVDYGFISDLLSGLVVLNFDKTVIEFSNSLHIKRIFKVTDDRGNVIDPYTALNELGTELANAEDKRQKEFSKELNIKYEKEKDREQEKYVVIGMTKDEVIEIWGKPKDINRTVTTYGIKEQWVYSNYRYLYFDDGVLTTIQD